MRFGTETESERSRRDQLRLQNIGAASGIAGQQQGMRNELADLLMRLGEEQTAEDRDRDQLRLQQLASASGIAGQQQGWRQDLADTLFGLEFASPDYTPLIQPSVSRMGGMGGGSQGGRRRLGRPGTRKIGERWDEGLGAYVNKKTGATRYV